MCFATFYLWQWHVKGSLLKFCNRWGNISKQRNIFLRTRETFTPLFLWLPDCSITPSNNANLWKRRNFGRGVGGTLRGGKQQSVQTNHVDHVNAREQSAPTPPRAAATVSRHCIKALSHCSGSTEEAQPLRWVTRLWRDTSSDLIPV